MVNFWATSCTTCVGEMPQMIDTYNKFKDRGLDFVAVAMSYDSPNYVLTTPKPASCPSRSHSTRKTRWPRPSATSS